MPEAAVYKDRNAPSGERNVCAPARPWHTKVHAKPKASVVKCCAKLDFRACVATL
jgi:hypothetical protein